MTDAKPFLSQMAETAAFACREYFRPLTIVARLLKSSWRSQSLRRLAMQSNASAPAGSNPKRKGLPA
jgi:hypothetical protein